MKKILCLILCIVLASATLVACSSDDDIGGGIADYPQNNVKEELLTLNMLIITGDSTAESASDSVATRIGDYVKRKYNTLLNITYVVESEYEAYLNESLNAKDGSAPHIVLINSEELFNSLHSADKLADLTSFCFDKEYEKDFGTLKTQITSALLEKSKVDGKLYTIPNNRVIGEYSYLVIDKTVAVQELKFLNKDIAAYKSLEDAAELMQLMEEQGYNSEELVRVVKGPYEMRFELSEGNICNIIEVPTVTTADAFASAFAVIDNAEDKYDYRAMRILYALNTDLQLRNYLQYGVSGANYNVNDAGDIVRIIDADNTYDMNLIYTGDVFKASFCTELKWTQSAKEYGILQNGDSVAK